LAVQSVERNIQYYGLLRPPSTNNPVKWWRLTADIIRPQISDYRNDKYPVPQGFWGYVQAMYAGRVLHTYRIFYKNDILAYNIDTDLFLQQNVSCHLEAMLTSFGNLANGLGLPLIQRNNPINDWRTLSLPIEEFKIRLIAEQTIFKFTYEYEEQETCEVPLSESPSQPPPPPPPPTQEFPPGTAGNQLPPISPPYQGENDNGQTYNPNPSEPPTFPDCTLVRVFVTITRGDNTTFSSSYDLYAPIGNAFATCTVDGNTFASGLIIQSFGTSQSGCQNQMQDTVIGGASGGGDANSCFKSIRIDNVAEI
jgi:hypothetical protein